MVQASENGPRPTVNRFMMEVEALVRAANRDAIARRIPKIGRQDLESLAQKTAELRADYLAAAFETDWTTADLRSVGLDSKRRLFEEAVAAFEALERAVRRGYIDID